MNYQSNALRQQGEEHRGIEGPAEPYLGQYHELGWRRLRIRQARHPLESIYAAALSATDLHARNKNDVVEAVRFARVNRLKIAVRGGGHSWVGFPHRDDSLLIDLGRLNQISMDRKARIARIQRLPAEN
jgi:FAD/FMN-containing dehydrogenase